MRCPARPCDYESALGSAQCMRTGLGPHRRVDEIGRGGEGGVCLQRGEWHRAALEPSEQAQRRHLPLSAWWARRERERRESERCDSDRSVEGGEASSHPQRDMAMAQRSPKMPRAIGAFPLQSASEPSKCEVVSPVAPRGPMSPQTHPIRSGARRADAAGDSRTPATLAGRAQGRAKPKAWKLRAPRRQAGRLEPPFPVPAKPRAGPSCGPRQGHARSTPVCLPLRASSRCGEVASKRDRDFGSQKN